MNARVSPAEIAVREIRVEDAEAVAQLSGELGYPAAVPKMADRIRSYRALADHVTYVACLAEDRVVAWIDVGVAHHLQAEPYAEIGGLVVANGMRNANIGSRLVARAEQWAAERGIRTVRVRSQIARERAHRFYLRLGYERTKTSAVFSKEI